MEHAEQISPVKGRGALTNRSSRFEREAREAVDDGWDLPDDPARPKTEVFPDASRTAITRNNSPDISFDRSVNPYKGCEHGCVYCFARPTHAFLGLSPGMDFETKIFARVRVAELLEAELSRPGYRPRVIALGANTDPYQPVEKTRRLTREVLEVLARFNHPVAITTKSHLVTRDIDIIAPMAARGLARVAISVTTLDGNLARRMEPRCPAPARRLDAIRTLSAAGIPTAVMVAPVIPSLNDHEIEAIMEAAAEAGAVQAGYVMLRLPLEIRDLFAEWLRAHVPDRANRVMALMRAMRGGKDYDARWFERQRGTGPYAEMIARRFRLAARRLGLEARRWDYDEATFSPPRPQTAQLSLAL